MFCGLIVSVLLFSGMSLASFGDAGDLVPRTLLLRQLGFGTLGTAIVIGLLVAILAEAREDLDIQALGRRGPQSIDAAFR